MDPRPSWSRVKEVVGDALSRPPDERAAFVAAACSGSPNLRREVESLLKAHDAASGFIERPANIPLAAIEAIGEPVPEPEPPEPAIGPGVVMGPYRIGRILGSGGMGTVYFGERADEAFHRQVAIKVVAGALARPQLVERFLNERRILAALDHPTIGRLLDAGATSTGEPYVVMELVDGEPIDQYCRSKPLAARLDVMRKVCAAVHYAHQHLVIHRDIKASNILVTQDGQPKLLDFGIAKLLESELEPGERTDTMARALTPESASPEQLRNEPVTIASDVYSLGVLLYRLIAEKKPFDQATSSAAELVKAICEVDPPPPSQAAAPTAPRLDAEIDAITMMAMRKEPSRRYGSAQQLAEDLGRYLDGRPVLAAPDKWTYRVSKFVRRRWGMVAATAGVILALAAGAAATYVQARRAERRFNDVRKLAGSVVGEIYDRIADLPGSTEARKVLVTRSLEYLDSLATEASGDTALQRELAGAYEKIGDVQGNPYGANLGDVAGAKVTYDKLLAIREAVFNGRDRTWDDVNELADAYSKHGDLAYGQGKYQESADAYSRGIQLLEANPPPADLKAKGGRWLARWYGRRGVALTAAGKPDEAIAALQSAIDTLRPYAEAPGAEPILGMELAIHSVNVGDVFNYKRNFSKALEYHQMGVAAMRRGLEADPKSVSPKRRLALTLARVAADLIELKQFDEAIVVERETVTLFQELADGDPGSVQFQFDLADVLGNLAQIHDKLGNYDEALAIIQKSLAISEAAVARNPNFADHRFNYGEAIATLALVQLHRGQAGESVKEHRRVLALYGEPGVVDRNPSVVPMAREGLGDALVVLARREKSDARWREALQEFERAREGWNAIKAKGALSADDAGKLDAIDRKIAECQAALGR